MVTSQVRIYTYIARSLVAQSTPPSLWIQTVLALFRASLFPPIPDLAYFPLLSPLGVATFLSLLFFPFLFFLFLFFFFFRSCDYVIVPVTVVTTTRECIRTFQRQGNLLIAFLMYRVLAAAPGRLMFNFWKRIEQELGCLTFVEYRVAVRMQWKCILFFFFFLGCFAVQFLHRFTMKLQIAWIIAALCNN